MHTSMNYEAGTRCLQNSRYSTIIHIIMIAIISETVFLHYNMKSRSYKLKLQIEDLHKGQAAILGKLAKVSQFRLNEKDGYEKRVRIIERKVHTRIKRGIAGSNQKVTRNLNALRLQTSKFMNEGRQLLALVSSAVVRKDSCTNVSMVCQKGERGSRGKAGPRGHIGVMGAKGDSGVAGPKGQRGPSGIKGEKGQKGDRGSRGKSIEKPTIKTKPPKEFILIESRNLTLFCEADGNPIPDVRWEVDNRKVDSRYTYPVKGAISILNIDRRDEGLIKCIAENILGKDIVETSLIVHTKPEVKLTSNRVIALAGVPLNIVCNAEGKPYPKLKWKKGFGQLTAQVMSSLNNRSLTLNLNTPVVTDTGYYLCEAENYVGKFNRSLLLTIIEARDCSGFKGNKRSGIYTINPDRKQSFNVYCDMETNGGGWTIIQRRADGSVDFFKNWIDYKLGFGNMENEFWLGNDKIHLLTKRKNMMIRFDLEDFEGKTAYAEYKSFYIDGEKDNYRLHIGSYSGTAGDSFTYHNGMQFTTKDRDHDRDGGNCAKHNHGAWWYKSCHYSNLNGEYLNGPHKSYADGVNWNDFKGYRYSLKKVEMKVRPSV